MRRILLLLALALFLYSPYGPEWGRFAVNMALILAVFLSFSKAHPKPRYYDEEEEYN